jgi:potassium-transporting ATPase KdpC subunit
MMNLLKQTLVCLLLLTIVTGVVYPLMVTGVAQLVFPGQANGSLIFRDHQAVGSSLIGQSFQSPGYFWSRPSATAPMPYNAANSSGSNLGPLNPVLWERNRAGVEKLRTADPGNTSDIPVDLVTASGSGLDPDITPAAAEYQIPRVAGARNIPPGEIRNLVTRFIKGRQLTMLGEPRVNVLELNLALEALEK